MDERIHRAVTLYLRHEPEGHGTLFMSWNGECEPEDLEAVGIVKQASMGAESCVRELKELIMNNAGYISEHMMGITTRVPRGTK